VTYLPERKGDISTNNSTTALLGAGATFTGVADDVTKYASVSVSYNSDVAGADNGLLMQFSPDGINWDRSIPVTPEANNLATAFGGVHMLSNINKFFRVVYTNGSTPQGVFRLQTVFHTERSLALVSRSDQVINKHNDVALVRTVSDFNHDKARGLFGYLFEGTLDGAKEDVTATEVTIWRKSGSVSYVFPTTAETVRVKAGGNAADTAAGVGARTVKITGLDASWNEVTDTLTTAGASASAVSANTYRRINKCEVIDSGTYGGANVGIVTIENTTALQELAIIDTQRGIADQAIYTVPAGKTMFVTRFTINVGDSNKSTIRGYVREEADVIAAPFRAPELFVQFNEFAGIGSITPETLRVIPEMSDFYMTAQRISGGGSSACSAEVDFDLVDNAS
jgi:hypothetical protein